MVFGFTRCTGTRIATTKCPHHLNPNPLRGEPMQYSKLGKTPELAQALKQQPFLIPNFPCFQLEALIDWRRHCAAAVRVLVQRTGFDRLSPNRCMRRCEC